MFFDRKNILNKLNKQSIVVGYDLGDETCKISIAHLDGEEPITLSTVAGEEQYSIPTVLCKRKEVNQWFYGKEALKNVELLEGILVDHLLQKAIEGTCVTVENQEIPPIELLALFIKKSFSMLGLVATMSNIAAIMITVDHLDEEKVRVLTDTIKELHVKENAILFQGHEESAYYYMMNQAEELRNGQSGILDFYGSGLKSYCLMENPNTIPRVYYMKEQDCPGVEKRNDLQLYEAANQLCRDNSLRSVYLLGDEFLEEWYPKSLTYLCMGRRVFQGSNLYSKGACFAIRERVQPSKLSEKNVFLGSDKLKANIGMEVEQGEGKPSYHALLNGGDNWYEARTETDFLLDSGNVVSVFITPLYGEESKRADVILSGIPIRPRKATRIHMELYMKSETVLHIVCKDLGFGDIFKSSELEWVKEFEI